MRCKECGFEVDNDKAFCPVCGAPMKVTADYEYIQAEIANKVDRFFNEDENEGTEKPKEEPKEKVEEIEEIRQSRKPRGRESRITDPEIDEKAKTKPISKTKPVFGNDSVFDDPYEEEEPPEEDIPPVRKRPKKNIDYGRSPKKKSQNAARIVTVLVIFFIIAAAAIGVMAITGVFSNISNQSGSSAGRGIASLTCNLEEGQTYEAPVQVVINKSFDGNVFYTLDGSEPSINSRMYSEPFEISAADVYLTYPNVTLRAVSYSQNSEKSGDLKINFMLNYDESVAAAIQETTTAEPETTTVITVNPPMISPSSGTYSSDTQIMVSGQAGASIYYTYDGTIPDTRSNLYTGPVNMIPGNSTFSAICVADGVQSDVTVANYTLEYGYGTSSGQAISNVINDLLWSGYINDYDCNTNEGYAALRHIGVYNIGAYTYYVIQVDFYDSNGQITDTQYRGVGVNYGNVYYLAPDGDSFYLY